MKKILFLAIMAMILVGCKKSELSKFNESLKGTWSVQSNKIEYYEGGFIRYEEEIPQGLVFNEVTFRPDLLATVLLGDNELADTRYDLLRDNNIDYVQFFNLSLLESQIFEIANLSPTMMTWKVKYLNIEYKDMETDENRISDYGILTIQFVKN